MNMRFTDASRRSCGEKEAGIIGIEALPSSSGGFARAWMGNGVSRPCAFARNWLDRANPGEWQDSSARERRMNYPACPGARRPRGLRRAGRAMIAPAGRPLRGMQNSPAEFLKNTIKFDKFTGFFDKFPNINVRTLHASKRNHLSHITYCSIICCEHRIYLERKALARGAALA